jgi:hypothetical protein
MLGALMKSSRYRPPRNRCFPLALILLPSRELAQQVHEEVGRLIKDAHFKAVMLAGGDLLVDQVGAGECGVCGEECVEEWVGGGYEEGKFVRGVVDQGMGGEDERRERRRARTACVMKGRPLLSVAPPPLPRCLRCAAAPILWWPLPAG